MKKIKKFFKQTGRRWSWALYRKRRILKTRIGDLIKDGAKLNIGCGDKKLKGYINIDIVPLEGTDVVMDVSRDLYLIPSGIADEIRLENVFEHFYRYQQEHILRDYYRILKKGGKLIIKGLPDLDVLIGAYLKKEKGITGERFDLFNVYRYTHGDPIPENSPHQLHKDIFTKESIRALLEKNGFRIETLKNEKFGEEHLALNIDIVAAKA